MNSQPIRRIVTGTRGNGHSYIESDGEMEGAFKQAQRPVTLTDLWHLHRVPASPDDDGRAPAGRPFTLSPLDGGVSLRVVQFDPMDPDLMDAEAGRRIFTSMNSGGHHVPESRHPFMHKTRTVDFGIVLQGTITMVLDEGSVEVSAGDVVIQRATNHAWENRGTEPAMVAFVLIDAAADEG